MKTFIRELGYETPIEQRFPPGSVAIISTSSSPGILPLWKIFLGDPPINVIVCFSEEAALKECAIRGWEIAK